MSKQVFTSSLTRAEISQKVDGVLMDALGVDEDELEPTAMLRRDLGAESIDRLDITFRLEKAFTADPEEPFKIPRGDLFSETWDMLIEDRQHERKYFDGTDCLTADGIALIKKKFPNIDTSRLKGQIDLYELWDEAETVASIKNYIATRLGLDA